MNDTAPFVPSFTFDVFGTESLQYQEHEIGNGIEIIDDVKTDEDTMDQESNLFSLELKNAGVEILPIEQFFTDGAVPPVRGS